MLQLTLGAKTVSTERPAFIMGIVNATPDSFFENSRGGLELARNLIDQGADILDIGGESTRPGFTPISAEEELKRILPLIRGVRKISDIPISIDTYKLSVIKIAAEEGVDIWNDVTSLYGSGVMNADGTAGIAAKTDSEKYSEASAHFLADSGLSVILMHTGSGGLKQVSGFLSKRADFCLKQGIKKEKIIVDPGIGFGKSTAECIELIKNPDVICDGQFPVLMALSRKRCIGEMTGREAKERLAGTLAADLLSVQKGAKIIRVHDVSSAFDTLNVMKNLQ